MPAHLRQVHASCAAHRSQTDDPRLMLSHRWQRVSVWGLCFAGNVCVLVLLRRCLLARTPPVLLVQVRLVHGCTHVNLDHWHRRVFPVMVRFQRLVHPLQHGRFVIVPNGIVVVCRGRGRGTFVVGGVCVVDGVLCR